MFQAAVSMFQAVAFMLQAVVHVLAEYCLKKCEYVAVFPACCLCLLQLLIIKMSVSI